MRLLALVHNGKATGKAGEYILAHETALHTTSLSTEDCEPEAGKGLKVKT
jgi:hypothetical protein